MFYGLVDWYEYFLGECSLLIDEFWINDLLILGKR